MTKPTAHKWTFPARFRAGAFSWRASALASQRLREAVSEIRKVAKTDPVLGAEGAIRLMEKLWPAVEHVDTSSGALGNAVWRALDALIPIIIDAPADERTRARWLERLWLAVEEDGVEYLSPVTDRWGEICGSEALVNRWAEDLCPTLRACWSDDRPGSYFRGSTACLSCLLAAGRDQEVLDLLELPRHAFWPYRRYGIQALLAMGRKAEAIQYAEASRGLNTPDAAIDQVCEEILISSGLHEEAYRRYGLGAATGASYVARFRAVAKRYPMKDKSEILADLIATTPGEEGKWFATAKDLGLYDLALTLASRSPCDPKTLTRAARDNLTDHPEFALGAGLAALHWLSLGWGYEITGADVVDAYNRAMEAAARLGVIEETECKIRDMAAAQHSDAAKLLRDWLSRRAHARHL